MNTDLEDQLRLDMERAIGDVRVPRGLALRAERHRRKRQKTLRISTAAATATALIGAVAIAGVTGTFDSAPSSPAARLTAYVINHVQRALAPSAVSDLIGSVKETYPPGTTLEPVPGGINGRAASTSADSTWSVGYSVVWADQASGASKFTAYTSGGQPVFAAVITHSKTGATETAVIYANSTWWTAPVRAVRAASPEGPGCVQGGVVYLRPGPGGGWPGFIRSQLACGAYTVVGHQVIRGIDAIKLAGSTPGSITLWIDPATYRPIQMTDGPVQSAFQWVEATPANLAQLSVPVPAGFQQVHPPPANPGLSPARS
jgi:hypothetical protein